MTELVLVSPVDDRTTEALVPAPRLDRLAGVRVGLLDNRKGNANVLLERTGELLAERGARVSARVEKRIFSRPAADDDIARLAENCDAVVTAVGD